MKSNKITILGILVFLFVNNSFSQERVNQVRSKFIASMDAQSEILSNIKGWSKIENSEGKFWYQSDLNDEISYLPAYKKSFAGFYSIQIFKFTIEGEHFCVLVKSRLNYLNQKASEYFVFTENELYMLEGATAWLDGLIPELNGYVVQLKYRDFVVGDFDPEVEILKNKELIRVLLLNDKRSISSKDCSGEYLFNFSLQKIKNDTIFRFNFLLDLNDNQPFSTKKNILSITDDYFETKLSNFTRLLNFSPYVNFVERKKRLEVEEKQKDSIRLNQLSVYIDSLNRNKPIIYNAKVATTYNDLYDERNIDSVRYFRYTIERPKIKNMESEQIPNYSISDLKPNEVFMITIDNRGKVTNTPYQKDYFQGINFLPGKINLYYQLDNVIPDANNIRDKCPFIKTISLNRSFVTPVSFRTNREKSTESSISIIKFKIKKDEVKILNKYTNSEGLYQELEQLLTSSKSAIIGRYQRGTYYLYLTRKKNYWYLIDEDGVSFRKLDEFSTQDDAVDIVKYQYGNSDTRCP